MREGKFNCLVKMREFDLGTGTYRFTYDFEGLIHVVEQDYGGQERLFWYGSIDATIAIEHVPYVTGKDVLLILEDGRQSPARILCSRGSPGTIDGDSIIPQDTNLLYIVGTGPWLSPEFLKTLIGR